MHDIKYFFLNKNNQTIQMGAKKFPERQITENIMEKTIFQNPAVVPPPSAPASSWGIINLKRVNKKIAAPHGYYPGWSSLARISGSRGFGRQAIGGLHGDVFHDTTFLLE
jgi:hypothetical protein